MADVERVLVSNAIQAQNGVLELVSLQVSPDLFSSTPAGQECSMLFAWCVDYTRMYQQQPTLAAIKRYFPEFVLEFSTEPLNALADEFLDEVRKRYFDVAVLELSRMSKDRHNWSKLDEMLLDKAREVSARMPSSGSSRFIGDMEQRIDTYEAQSSIGYKPGIPLGIPVIDDITDGVRTGWLTTFAGFSGLGKTTLGTIASLSACEIDQSVLFLSLEMSRKEVEDRLDTMVNHFRHRDLIRRELAPEVVAEWRQTAGAYKHAAGEIVILDKLGGCNVDRVHAEIQRYRPKLVVVDYVQRMGGTKHSMAKWEGLDEITNDLKTIAMETESAVIMISQDGRSAAEEGSTRTSGANSQAMYTASDLYIGMQQTEESRSLNKMRIKLLKFRHGNWGAEVDMKWLPETGHFTKFEDTMAYDKKNLPPQPPAPR